MSDARRRAVTDRHDPYLAYIDRFFNAWLPVYDLFGSFIVPVYRGAVAAVSPRAGLEVLDICTGTGEMALRLARKGAVVTGIDSTVAMLDAARRKRGPLDVRFEPMDARELAFPDKSFDVSVLSLALHDMPRPVRLAVLAEARRVTRDRIVIVDYHFPRRRWLRRPLVRAVQLFETAYLARYADEEVQPLLDALGLETVEFRSFWPLVFGLHVVRP